MKDNESKIWNFNGRWLASYGKVTRRFGSMKEAAKWLEESKESDEKEKTEE